MSHEQHMNGASGMTKDLNNKTPLLIADFIFTSISQHSPAQGAQNLITINISTRCILPVRILKSQLATGFLYISLQNVHI